MKSGDRPISVHILSAGRPLKAAICATSGAGLVAELNALA